MMAIGEARMRLRVGRPCTQKLMDSGQLKFVKMSARIIRISESALKEYIEQAENPQPPAPQQTPPAPEAETGAHPKTVAIDDPDVLELCAVLAEDLTAPCWSESEHSGWRPSEPGPRPDEGMQVVYAARIRALHRG